MKNISKITVLLFAVTLIHIIACNLSTIKEKAWDDNPQLIPGKLECEFYNLGGEGIAYHDSDSVNNGSGKLNPSNGNYFNEFRMHEGVDISYTKSNNIDNNPFNKVEPEMNQLYVGWTVPNEWINYTVNVQESGTYKIGIKYTSNRGGSIEIISKYTTSGILKIESTYNNADTVAWRQWHHWNKDDSVGAIDLDKGIQIITLKTLENGNMNYDYIVFNLTHN